MSSGRRELRTVPDAALVEALNAYKPEIAARYERLIRSQFERMVAKLGSNLKEIANDWTFAKQWNRSVKPNTRYIKKEGLKPCENDGEYMIDDAKLARNAAMHADSTVAAWADKIAGKLGELDDAHVERLGGGNFIIRGSRGGRRINIEQNLIVNVSPKGTLFNQFPSRIYVDGKFTSEAAYKRMFG